MMRKKLNNGVSVDNSSGSGGSGGGSVSTNGAGTASTTTTSTTTSSSYHRISSSFRKRSSSNSSSSVVLGVGSFIVISIMLLVYCNYLPHDNNNIPSKQQQQSDQPSITQQSDNKKSISIENDKSTLRSKKSSLQTTESQKSSSSSSFSRLSVQQVREEFYMRYGGKEIAHEIYKKGITHYGTSVNATAQRLLSILAQHTTTDIQQQKQPTFVLSFAGYSVTVGRGNHLSQSYPMVLQQILQPLLQNTLHIQTQIRNAAIGGIPSFPYGFCFSHFLSSTADVISWDYSMNEKSSSASILESYLRHSQSQLSHHPMMIVLDMNPTRCSLLKQYIEQGLLQDGICVGMVKDNIVSHKKEFIDPNVPDNDSTKPIGFQHWQDFGANPTCPGRGNWHPKYQEHALIGWMIAMYFCDAIELAQHQLRQNPILALSPKQRSSGSSSGVVDFPPPLTKPPDNNPLAVTELLYGHPILDTSSSDQNNNHRMKHVSCRTNFLPATDTDRVLPSIVVSGLSPDTSAESIMTPRTDASYQAGWVLDVSTVERTTKVSVEKCGGLGYIDMKIALYGVADSGPLRLWLPYENANGDALHENHKHHDTDTDISARHWYDTLVICEANEKRSKAACQLDQDMEYTVGGSIATRVTWIHGAAEYLQRPTCIYIEIPETSKITRLSQLETRDGSALPANTKQRLLNSNNNADDDPIGLVIDIHVKSKKVNREQGACCISHVVWEEH